MQDQHFLELAEESASKGGIMSMRLKLGNDLSLASDVFLPQHDVPLALSEVILQDAAIHA